MRDYQRKDSDLPEAVYQTVLWTVRDYERRKQLGKDVSIIDDAFNSIPDEYIKALFDNIVNGTPYPNKRAIYSMYKGLLIKYIAKRLKLI